MFHVCACVRNVVVFVVCDVVGEARGVICWCVSQKCEVLMCWVFEFFVVLF
jgi:hypothetical protein